RRSKPEIKSNGDTGQKNQCADGHRTAAPERRSDRQSASELRSIGCRNKTARNFHPRRIGLGRADQPSGAIALDFVKLVTINSKIAAGLRIRRLAKRPQDGEY